MKQVANLTWMQQQVFCNMTTQEMEIPEAVVEKISGSTGR